MQSNGRAGLIKYTTRLKDWIYINIYVLVVAAAPNDQIC